MGSVSYTHLDVYKRQVPDEAKEIFKNGDYQMMLVSSKYETASDEVNNQITEIKRCV